jgi:hypothetical protein
MILRMILRVALRAAPSANRSRATNARDLCIETGRNPYSAVHKPALGVLLKRLRGHPRFHRRSPLQPLKQDRAALAARALQQQTPPVCGSPN